MPEAGYILTHRVYPVDEVGATLITALIQGRDLSECYYWIFELYHSGLDVFLLLERIYLDFYFSENPLAIGEYIIKKQLATQDQPDQLEKDPAKEIASIVRNLFRAKASSSVFIVRQLFLADLPPNKIYRRPFPAWLAQFPKLYHILLLAIHSQHWTNICYYLKRCFEHPALLDGPLSAYDKLEVLLKIYFQRIRGWTEPWPALLNTFDAHYLLALLSHVFRQEATRSTAAAPGPAKMLFLSPKPEDIAALKILDSRRQPYQINPHIRDFKLARYAIAADHLLLLAELDWHWLFYAAHAPIWFKRLEAHNGTIDYSFKQVIFLDDDDKERFYEAYDFDFEEQPPAVKAQSQPALTTTRWLDMVFPGSDISCLPSNWLFQL